MTTLTLDTQTRERPRRSLLDKLVEERERPAPGETRAVAAAASGATLDALVARSWSTLRVTRAASCLLCGGEVAPRYGAGPSPVGGACRSCGTEIA
ncbi:MAG TPA: hypothetical protein VF587_17545 [Solirubrobacteraceae bacterium]|jgi:hypothetical protein